MSNKAILFTYATSLLAVFLSWALAGPMGIVLSGVVGIGVLIAAHKAREETDEPFEGYSLFGSAIPWERTEPPTKKPNLTLSGYGFRQVTLKDGIWTEHCNYDSYISTAFIFAVTNFPYAEGRGIDATRIRAQIHWEYDTGVAGPSFSPAMWLDELCGMVDIPVGWCKILLIGIKSQHYWDGYDNRRINPYEPPKSRSESVPGWGVFLLRIIDDNGEILFQAKWKWSEDPRTFHPTITAVPLN